jgi:hypothetical protein
LNSTPTKVKIKLNVETKSNNNPITPKTMKQSKMMSTKERKTALMTPQNSKRKEEIMNNLIVINSENLETMVMEHKKNIK